MHLLAPMQHALPLGRAWNSHRAVSGYGHVGRCLAWALLGAGRGYFVERARSGSKGWFMSFRSYLDHSATSPLRPEARDAMIAALECAGNPSSVHAEGREARGIVENARETVARVFQVKPQAVTFTSGGTEAVNWLLQARPGHKLVASAVEHPCVLNGHRFTAEDVHIVSVSSGGVVDLEELERALTSPAIVVVQAANNETGVIQPLSDVASLTKIKTRLCRVRCRAGGGTRSASRPFRSRCLILLRSQIRRSEGRRSRDLAERRAGTRAIDPGRRPGEPAPLGDGECGGHRGSGRGPGRSR